MSTPLLTRPVTVADLEQFPDDGTRNEIIEGELFVAAAPARKHQFLGADLFYDFYQAVRKTGWGRAMTSPVDVRFTEFSQVQPDIVCIRRDRLAIYRGGTVFGPPDVVVEILSPSNRSYDLVKKANLYAQYGVPEYWIGDPDAPALFLLALKAGVYVPVEPENGLLRSTVVPGLVVDPAALFADLDE